jgi:hypothetical protein
MSYDDGRWVMTRERMGTNNLWDFLIIAIEESDAEENVMFYPLGKKTSDQSILLGKWAEYLCDPLDEKNSMIEHFSQIIMWQCASHNKSSHLAFLHEHQKITSTKITSSSIVVCCDSTCFTL